LKLEITNLRRKIYEHLKQKALGHEGGQSKELKAYQKDQENFSLREFQASNIDELLNSVSNSKTIYLGDFHTFDQNIRNVLRILKVLINKSNDCIVALEMVDARYQFYIDTYLEGHITDLEFLESIDYHDSWRFPWTHYKLIFELAKEHNIKIIGLNTAGTLSERDKFAAGLIQRTHKSYPDTQVLVVYGELHISPDKIPQLVSNEDKSLTHTIIHQNLDEVYWKQIENNDNNKVIKFNENEFCINSAPPWIKYESMIYWYENLCDDPEFDIHEYIIENGKKIFSEDTHENFFHICHEMIKAIKIDFDIDELEDFNLLDHTSLEFVEEKIYNYENSALSNFYQHLIYTGQSFRLPDHKTFYCSSYSMNRIAYLAGIHIYHYFLNQNNRNAFEILNDGSQEEKFVHFTLESLFAFFFSKVINPHRKCEMYIDLRHFQAKAEHDHKKKVIKAAIESLDDSSLQGKFKNFHLHTIHESALFVGHILGEYLYEHVFNLNKAINLESDFLNTTPDNFSFQRVKKILLKGTPYKKHQKRYF
jgi:hypothetical protein